MRRLVAGIDEAGRGPLAGPVVAAAVVFPHGYKNSAIKDSKILLAKQREKLAEEIKRDSLQWSVVAVGARRIERLNIRQATRLAMSLALRRVSADFVRIDGDMAIDTELAQETVIGGDALHVEISAASIIAKVYRDSLMATLERKYPGYGLGQHKGYATMAHRKAIEALGPCKIHRRTFCGVREYLPNVAQII